MWFLILILHTHAHIDGHNRFVKVCVYSHTDHKTSYEKYYLRKRYVVHPDFVCPRSFYET